MAVQIAFAVVNGKMCQASAESLGQSVKGKVVPSLCSQGQGMIKEGRGGSLVPH